MLTKKQFDALKVGSRVRSSGKHFPTITNRLGTVTNKTKDRVDIVWDAVPGSWAYTNTRDGYACLKPCEALLDINEII